MARTTRSRPKTFKMEQEQGTQLVSHAVGVASCVSKLCIDVTNLVGLVTARIPELLDIKIEEMRVRIETMRKAVFMLDHFHEEFEHIGAAAQAFTRKLDNEQEVYEKTKNPMDPKDVSKQNRHVRVALLKIEKEERDLRSQANARKHFEKQAQQRPGRDDQTRPLRTEQKPLTHHIDPAKLGVPAAPAPEAPQE